MNLSETKNQFTIIDEDIIYLQKTLMQFDSSHAIPEELHEKINVLIDEIEEKYMPLPKTKNGVEVVGYTYQRCLRYKEKLD